MTAPATWSRATACRTAGALLAAASVVWSPYAIAAPSEADKAAAQSLFDEARALVAKRSFALACEKFSASQKLDPRGGTLMNLAACNEQLGKLATAWTEFNEALSIAIRDGRKDRIAFARTHIAAIEPNLSHVTVRVAAADVAAISVTFDGELLAREAWDKATPVDPGSHTVEARAPRRLPFHTKVDLGTKEDVEVDVPALALDPDAAPPPASPAAQTERPAPPAPPSSAVRHAAGGVVLGVGLVAAGVGGYFGVRAFSKWRDATASCPNDVCTAQGASATSDAKTDARISDFALPAGLVVAAVGAYFLFTSSGAEQPARTTALRVGASAGGPCVAVEGAW